MNKQKIRKAIELLFTVVILAFGTAGYAFSFSSYPKIMAASGYLENNIKVTPKEKLVIKFSDRMLPASINGSLRIEPEVSFFYEWKTEDTHLIITPQKTWKPDQIYTIKIRNGRTIMWGEVDQELKFSTISYPEFVKFSPEIDSKDVIIDIEDPITASFSGSLKDFKIKFVFNPLQEMVYNVDLEKSDVELLPKEKLKEGQKYEIALYLKHKEEKEYRPVYKTHFETKPPPPPVDSDNPLESAKFWTQAVHKQGKYIDINVKDQVMIIFEEGKALDSFRISSGKRGMDTPQGEFKVYNKHPRPWSGKYALYMPFWMAITASGEYGIHELPEWPGGYKEGADHLGIPVSHGCVRLGIGPAERVYSWAEIGIPVVVHD